MLNKYEKIEWNNSIFYYYMNYSLYYFFFIYVRLRWFVVKWLVIKIIFKCFLKLLKFLYYISCIGEILLGNIKV